MYVVQHIGAFFKVIACMLDIPINTMFVDEEDCWLYGTTLDFEHESEGIVRFKLPDSTTK